MKTIELTDEEFDLLDFAVYSAENRTLDEGDVETNAQLFKLRERIMEQVND